MQPIAAIYQNPKLLPASPGAYAWFFDVLPTHVPQNDYVTVDGFRLLYVGIAVSESLRRRIIGCHLYRANTSTLRRTLGCLLIDVLNLRPLAQPRNKFWWGRDGEARLTDWLQKHARIAHVTDTQPEDIESAAISRQGPLLPLNIQKNQANPFGRELRARRRACCGTAHKEL